MVLDSTPKKLFLGLSTWDDELLEAPKIETFPENSLAKPHVLAASNVIPKPVYKYFLLPPV